MTYQESEVLLFLDRKSVKQLGVVHERVIFPVHVKDQDDVVLLGSVGEESEHGDPAVTGPVLPVEDVGEEGVEPLSQDPGTLCLHYPVLHLPQPLLLLPGAEGHDGPHEVLEVLHMLETQTMIPLL